MTFALGTQFLHLLTVGSTPVKHSSVIIDVKAVVGAFNQEKALVGAFFVIMNLAFGWTFLKL